MRSQLTNTWCLVTGASSGLGEELSRQLAHRGAHLILTARSEDRLARLADDLRRVNGVQTRVIAADLASEDGATRLLDEVRASGVFVEHLINNAGFGTAGPFTSLDAERERRMVLLNVEAVVRLTRGLLEPMCAAGRGGILNVSSTASFQPVPYMATYGASKAFVTSFTLALASELAGTGVRAMVLCPGPVPTGFQRAAGIERPGIKASVLNARTTVERALEAYERGERIYTPGLVNSVQAAAVRVLPRGLVSWAAARTMKRLGRTSSR